jgi:hypothetical protein
MAANEGAVFIASSGRDCATASPARSRARRIGHPEL